MSLQASHWKETTAAGQLSRQRETGLTRGDEVR